MATRMSHTAEASDLDLSTAITSGGLAGVARVIRASRRPYYAGKRVLPCRAKDAAEIGAIFLRPKPRATGLPA